MAQSALAALAEIEPDQPGPARRGKRTPPATLMLIRALLEAGTKRRDIEAATGMSPSGLAYVIKRERWQGLALKAPIGVSSGARDQLRAPDASLTQLQHREAARQLRERVALILKDERLGAGERGSMSKAALELARALTVAIDTERRCIGLDDQRTAGGRSPGVVILLPAQQAPDAWGKTASAARKELRRREAPKRIKATVVTAPPPPADDDDDAPDLDAEDDEEGET